MSDEARRVAGGGAASLAALRASSDVLDRKPAAAGSPPPGAAAAATAGHKIQLKSADMKEEMRQEAFDIARVAFEKHTMEKDIAEYIKKEFDKNHGPTWHCIVGRNFGSYVTHETNYFVYFYIDSKAVLLFKSG
ncbi:dynein light chain 1, cytoplasmic [Oryza brachyantha]|uniref:dynein light chain 1, cytoplasmic n=1 Tax=Oryza brachyantha TaxID=4533 RepID=UPI001AD9724C|nr:dynein light chain 1, cytoplasmic [Oryza brachyantha]